MHKPILIKNLGLSFPHKICFEEFTNQVNEGDHIAIIGRNGSGKSTLLRILQNLFEPTYGDVVTPNNVRFGYITQILDDKDSLSGGERFSKALAKVLNQNPDIFILDEPTNHLDLKNRKTLFKALNLFQGTIIVVTHDIELLNMMDILWHIDNHKISVFKGSYNHYIRDITIKRSSIEQKLAILNTEKKNMHNKLMKEQTRAAKSKVKGQKSIEQRKWPTIVSHTKVDKASLTAGAKKSCDYTKERKFTE